MQDALNRVIEKRRKSLASLQAHPLASKLAVSHDPNRPCSLFILGPSRSGKSTLEKLLSSLPGVKRGFENPIVSISVRRTFQSSALLTSSSLELLPLQHRSLCGEIYLEEITRRAASAQVFTNTLSGLIHDAARMVAVFPNARFVFMKRAVSDNALQIFMRKYRRGNAYAYDLKATREHILWYHQMIDLMVDRFPAITRVINYEDMVADPTSALRDTAAFCGLTAPAQPANPIEGDQGCSSSYLGYME